MTSTAPKHSVSYTYSGDGDLPDAHAPAPTLTPPPIQVTRPFLPPQSDLAPYLDQIWSTRILTNNGPLHAEFEAALGKYLGVENVSLFSNCTLALILALKALRLQGEVITSPFSFVATANAISWAGLTPVFVDIDPDTLNIDPEKIQGGISPKTSAIMPVHVYGRPCDRGSIARIAQKYNLRVIYDAAHAFGSVDHGHSVASNDVVFGDFSCLSFHATKLFNTFEGGAVISATPALKASIDRLKNFGHDLEDDAELHITDLGMNAKMNEFQAAVGLAQLKHVPDILDARERIAALYHEHLQHKWIRFLPEIPGHASNNSYMPVRFISLGSQLRAHVGKKLKDAGIFSRRYFYPLISDLPLYRNLPSANPRNLPIARQVASEILCLPIYPGLEEGDVIRITEIIKDALR